MKNKDKWAMRLRDKMEGYSEPLPNGLWERMETEISAPRVIPMWRTRRFVVAAAMLIAAVSLLTVWLMAPLSDKTLYLEPALAEKKDNLLAPDEKPVPSSAEIPFVKNMPEKPLLALASEPVTESVQPVALNDMEVHSEEVKDDELKELPAESTHSRSGEPVVSYRSLYKADREQMQRNRDIESRKRKRQSDTWSVGVNAGNTPYSSSSSYNGLGQLSRGQSLEATVSDMASIPDGDGQAYNQVLLNNRDQVSKTEVHHKMPVTVGASFKWNFTPHWAVETGLAYTMLASDLRSGSGAYLEEEQKLHYIGIPLKLHRSLYTSRWFSFYASAGGMVEKCVSANQDVVYVNGMSTQETEHHSLDIDALQWSVSASAGMQVNFTKQFGLYAEPGIVYYFDDNSGVETIRKEHPFNFNLQVGLRFSFGR